METVEFLYEAVTILATAVVVVLISTRLRIPPVVGFLLSGILIGPSGLALVPETGQVEIFAEIGVVMLLFVIGLHLDPAELRGLGRSFLLGGTLQWLLTTGSAACIVALLGLPLANAVFFGFVVSLSSTAVVLKEYHERRESTTPQGKVDARSDMFELGATYYHMIAGKAPFEGTSPLQVFMLMAEREAPAVHLVNASVPIQVSDVIKKMMSPEPEDRYQTMEELIDALDQTESLQSISELPEELDFPVAEAAPEVHEGLAGNLAAMDLQAAAIEIGHSGRLAGAGRGANTVDRAAF